MKFIAAADTHLRYERPRCRTDADWLATQREALRKIYTFANEKGCPVLFAGDIFHSGREPNEIMDMFLAESKNNAVGMIAGNHDLPYHSYQYVGRSSYGVIQRTIPEIQNLPNSNVDAYHFDTESPEERGICSSKILFLHELVFESEDEIPEFIKAKTAAQLLEEHPEYNWIICGDNHKAFHYSRKGRHVINPGTMLVQRADEIGYRTGVYFVDTELNIVERLELPPDLNSAVSIDYLLTEEARNERVELFVNSVRDRGKLSLSFLDNMKDAISRAGGSPAIPVLKEVMEFLSSGDTK